MRVLVVLFGSLAISLACTPGAVEVEDGGGGESASSSSSKGGGRG